MERRGDPDKLLEVNEGIEIWYHAWDNYYHFMYEGKDYRRSTAAEARALLAHLRGETAEREAAEEAAREEAEEVIDEDRELTDEERRALAYLDYLESIERMRRAELDEVDLVDEVDEIEEPEVVDLVPIPEPLDLPALPWYAAWLEPILKYIGNVTEAVVNFIAPYFEPFGEIAGSLIGLPASIVTGFVDAIGSLTRGARDTGTGIAVETLADVVEGSPPWMKDIQQSIEALETRILSTYNEAVTVETYEESPLAGEQAVEALGQMKQSLLTAAILNFGLHALVESGSLGQLEFMRDLDSIVVSKFGLSSLIERATMLPIEKAILVPAEQEYLTRHPNTIPTATELINMVVKEVIPLDRFKAEMLKLGFKDEWSQYIWDAHFIPPNFDQILRSYYRGVITREELETLKILVDLDPRFNAIWDAQIEVIPPYQELVNQRVKEVITKEDFEKYLQWHGFDPVWAERIWLASKIPPALGDLLTAWRRDLIDESRLDELMILVDLDPRFKDIFDTRKYIDPSITVARYMFETGAIDRDVVHELVSRAGYLPEYVDAVTEFIVRFQERRFRTFYLRALQTGIVAGAYTPDELIEEVTKAGYTEETAQWMIKTAEVRTRIKETKAPITRPRILTVADLKKAYSNDKITEDELRRELGIRGYETGDIEILIELMNLDKEQKVIGRPVVSLSPSQILNAWRYEVITEDEAQRDLMIRGLDEAEVFKIMETKKRQWGLTES